MQQVDDFVVFDLETQRSADEVGGWRNLHEMGISVAVLYESATDSTQAFREAEMGRLVEHLQQAPLIVGFNLLSFDYPVLQPYTNIDLPKLPTVDLLRHIYRKLGWRVSLDNLGHTTLNTQKSASGLQAITWYRQGQWDRLIRYCTDDVIITRDLYLFGKRHGFVKFWDKRNHRECKVQVRW